MEDALAAGALRVSEVSAEGHVPELRVGNSGEAPVLILDGEELVGAKQNRIVNVTILVPPHAEVVIPVSCIEAGRWAYYRIGGVLAGLDLFGSERMFARSFLKLVRGSALQALAGYKNGDRPPLDDLPFLRSALAAPADRFPAVGLDPQRP